MPIDASSSSVVGYDAVLHDAHWEFKTNKRWTRMDEQANNFVEQQWQHFQSSSKNKIGKARFTLSPSVWGDDKSNRYEIDFLAMTIGFCRSTFVRQDLPSPAHLSQGT